MSVHSILLLALAMIPGAASAQSEVTGSVGWALQGCRNFLAGADFQAFKQGYCGGVVSSLMTLGHDLSPGRRYCVGDGVTVEQATRVVIVYLERRPILLQEPFQALAREAFREAWPCR